ncbi:hypothetical protein M407DRAFT_27989 [Tulasnella calospora MUT 4182]|uniref:Uncharacterized protein n=1 Tax=Tulasnella calospora MUT 4182 TaxID=1051891 RepID=A0A0C3LMC6_9AGAM|nr:hypothetical protein M407DRAFT_27989 [Tulasnella calospora MUT 4182]
MPLPTRSPFDKFINELTRNIDSKQNTVSIIRKHRDVFWPITAAIVNNMVQVGRKRWPQRGTVGEVLADATAHHLYSSLRDNDRVDLSVDDLLAFLAVQAIAFLLIDDTIPHAEMISKISYTSKLFLPAALELVQTAPADQRMVAIRASLISAVGGSLRRGVYWKSSPYSERDQDQLMEIAFSILLDPSYPFTSPFEEHVLVRSSVLLFQVFMDWDPRILAHVKQAINKYGSASTMKRIKDLNTDTRLDNDSIPDIFLGLTVLGTAGTLLPWLESGVPCAVLQRNWRLRLRDSQGTPSSVLSKGDSASVVIVHIGSMVQVYALARGWESVSRHMTGLLQKDLLALCGKALLSNQTKEGEGFDNPQIGNGHRYSLSPVDDTLTRKLLAQCAFKFL